MNKTTLSAQPPGRELIGAERAAVAAAGSGRRKDFVMIAVTDGFPGALEASGDV
jgi:hypothetical protein